jgi:hypothetical protein
VIHVDQLVLHNPNDDRQLGDCLRACIASLLDLDASEVPHFVQIGSDAGDTATEGNRWYDELRRFLTARGMDVAWCPADRVGEFLPWSLHDEVLVCGPSPRGVFSHIVVGTPDGTVLHDPHPSRDGLAGTPTSFAVVTRVYDEEIPA